MDVQHSPPCGNDIKGLFQEAVPDDQSRPIEHLAVDVNLSTQPAQAVSVRLDFVAVQKAVHDGNVDSHSATTEPQLLEEDSIRLSAVLAEKSRSKSWANGGVAKVDGTFAHRLSVLSE